MFPGNKDFGAWWDAQGFGLGYQERAALVRMGENIDAARKCLAETQSRSIQLIAKQELPRFDSAIKTPEPPASPSPQPSPAPARETKTGAKPRTKRGESGESTGEQAREDDSRLDALRTAEQSFQELLRQEREEGRGSK
jgi:hypothetical protein